MLTLPACAQTIAGPSPSRSAAASGPGLHRAVGVDRDPRDAGRAEAEQPQRLQQRDVDLVADEDADGRRAGQPVLLDVPARAREHAVAGGGEPDQVRHRRAGHEADAGVAREPERLEQPARGDVLHGGARGRDDAAEVRAVPGRDEPVGGDRHGQRAAGHEAEVARARRSRPSRARARPARSSTSSASSPCSGSGRVERGQHVLEAERGADAPVAAPWPGTPPRSAPCGGGAPWREPTSRGGPSWRGISPARA